MKGILLKGCKQIHTKKKQQRKKKIQQQKGEDEGGIEAEAHF